MHLSKERFASVHYFLLFATILLPNLVHGGAFIWGEYAAKNELDPYAFLSPASWVATRCSKFEGEESYPDERKCADGGDCLNGVPCGDGGPCICNDGKKDKQKNLGFTGNEEFCVTAKPCQFQVIDPDRVADCLPECDTLTRNSLMQLTDRISSSCDYSSFQSILSCGNCVLVLCEFENRFNPSAKSCATKYYNEIWPCYKKHFLDFCQLDVPVCSAPASQLEFFSGFLIIFFLFCLLQ